MKNNKIVFYFFLLLIIFIVLVIKNNAVNIYAFLSGYYFEHNDILKGQSFYEKSYKLGNTDKNLRNTYVNSLLNSNLTIEAQEKLAKIATDEIPDISQTRAQYALLKLYREVIKKYPRNYIKQAPYNNKIMHWGKMPITYMFINSYEAPLYYTQEIKTAFIEWERASMHKISLKETTDENADIVIEFIKNESEDFEYNKKYVVAYTIPNLKGNKLERMEIKFNIKNLYGQYYEQNQIHNVALHEIFHALGFMGHSYNKTDIMFMSNESYNNDERKILNRADTETLRLLYKIKPDITNGKSERIVYEYVPYVVLGNSEDINNSKIKEAANYIKRAPNLPGGYIDMAESFAAKKQYTQAVQVLNKALSLSDNNDTNYIVYYNLAVCYFYLGDYKNSEIYIKKAKSLNNSEELHLITAEIYVKQNLTKQAISEYRELLKQSPNNIEYVINLANIYVKKHDYFGARKLLKNYIKNNPREKNNERLKSYGILIWGISQ